MATAVDAQDKKFADLAIAEGVTEEQVEECLAIRAKLVKAGAQAKTLPEILLAKGYITKEISKKLAETSGLVPAAGGKLPKIPGYDVLELLGKGGMGAVYKARQLSLDRIVALKVLSSEAARDETYVRRFMTEARALARLNHENIISGIDVGESSGVRYFAMEYVEGEPLSGTIEREGALPEKRVLKISMQVARALAHADKNGLVHRDVKPQNIMLGRNDVAKLCDLGLAMTADERKEARDRGQSIGTPHYISPEQARGEHKVDIRSDIYSLGATLYHASTGETPFQGTSSMVLMTKHLTEEPIAPKKRRPGISKGLNDLILQMMAKEKERRFQTPIELLEEMERLLAGRGGGGGGQGGQGAGGQKVRGSGRVAAGGATASPRSGLKATEQPKAKPARPAARVARPAAARREAPAEDDGEDDLPRGRRGGAPEVNYAPLMITVAVLVFGGLGALLVWKGSQSAQQEREAPPPPSQEFEDAAKQSLINVTAAFNAGKIDKFEAINLFKEISGKYPGTVAGKEAEEYAKRVQAAPLKRTDGADAPEGE